MKKKILIVDDSALMRRVLCDIINSDDRFEVADTAINGAEGFKLIVARRYDAVVLDVYMPQMTGLEMLKEMQNSNVHANVLMASTTTGEGARETLTALEYGAIDFIKKPENVADARLKDFSSRFLELLDIVANAGGESRHAISHSSVSRDGGKVPTFTSRYDVNFQNQITRDREKEQSKLTERGGFTSRLSFSGNRSEIKLRPSNNISGRKIVAIASSTGGPKALQEVIPKLPKDLKAPVLLVQHMPKGFTQSLAERLDELSEIKVTEAVDGERLENGHVYIAQGGVHLNAEKRGDGYFIKYSDQPTREGVKPCANYMFESLANSNFDEVVCVVLTGMGSDGTVGIEALEKKKKIHVIAQDQDTSTVYGMPKSIALTGLTNEIVPLQNVAAQIIKNVGVR